MRLPAALVDPVARLQQRLTVPDPDHLPVFPRPKMTACSTKSGAPREVLLQDVGFIGAVRSRKATPWSRR